MKDIFKHGNKKKEYVFDHCIHVGPQIITNDSENLAVKNKYACCDCSKESSLVGILSGTFGFVIGLLQSKCCVTSSQKVVIVKLIIFSLLVLSIGGAITGKEGLLETFISISHY